MLPLVLAAVIAQSPQIPQIFIPGVGYDDAHFQAAAGPAIASCAGELRTLSHLPTRVRSSDALRTLAMPGCDAELVIAGASSVEPASVTTTRGEDAGSHSVDLRLHEQTWTLSSVPFSDGGVRVWLQGPDGQRLTLFEAASATADSTLVWAGDLNGDRALDVVLKSSEGFTSFQQLFLSDEAGLPSLVAEVLLRD